MNLRVEDVLSSDPAKMASSDEQPKALCRLDARQPLPKSYGRPYRVSQQQAKSAMHSLETTFLKKNKGVINKAGLFQEVKRVHRYESASEVKGILLDFDAVFSMMTRRKSGDLGELAAAFLTVAFRKDPRSSDGSVSGDSVSPPSPPQQDSPQNTLSFRRPLGRRSSRGPPTRTCSSDSHCSVSSAGRIKNTFRVVATVHRKTGEVLACTIRRSDDNSNEFDASTSQEEDIVFQL